jgi:EAL domain-containing protein (putative c-di-GMP-specific phosphodiesterase class I)
MAVNVSMLQFDQRDFPELVARVLRETGLEPHYLELEITETVLMKDAKNTIDILRQFKALGVKLAVDDFGTGYSSLSRLKYLPLDRLKIDRSFIRTITSEVEDQAIATAIIAMADSLNLRVIAEGVETDRQLKVLKARHCNEIQGYYVSQPLPGDQAEKFLRHLADREAARRVPQRP